MAKGSIFLKKYKKKNTKNVAISVPRLKKVILSLEETKFVDIAVAATAMPVTWTFVSGLTGISQGTSANTRIGNKIHLKSVEWNILMTPTATVSTGGAMCRFIAYHNKETVGTLVTRAMLWQTDEIHTLRQTSQLSRVTVIRDAMHTMVVTGVTSAGVTATSGPMRLLNIKIYPKKRIDFTGNTATITDVLKDDYGLGFICDDGAGASSVTFQYNQKITFTDA